MANCPAVSAGGAFLSTLLQHIDCQGQSIGSAGYQALAQAGSPLSMVLSALLTIFIALFGLRMVLGETPSLREGVIAAVKVGVVLLIATSWPAYQTIVYDVIVKGPAQLGAAIAVPSRLPGANSDLIDHLQVSDDAITRLTTLGSGRNDLTSAPAAGTDGRAVSAERAPVSDDIAFGSARLLFLSSIVAAFAIVRLGAGVLLALAPLFAGLLLFDIGRGLFTGWARALVFTMLGSVAVTIILGVELALLEPWLTEVLRLRYARIVTPEAPLELLVLCLGFAAALAGALGVILRLSFMIDVPFRPLPKPDIETTPVTASGAAVRFQFFTPSLERPACALGVASAVAAAQRREAAFLSSSPSSRPVAVSSGLARVGVQGMSGRHGFASSSRSLHRKRPRKSIASALRDRQP